MGPAAACAGSPITHGPSATASHGAAPSLLCLLCWGGAGFPLGAPPAVPAVVLDIDSPSPSPSTPRGSLPLSNTSSPARSFTAAAAAVAQQGQRGAGAGAVGGLQVQRSSLSGSSLGPQRSPVRSPLAPKQVRTCVLAFFVVAVGFFGGCWWVGGWVGGGWVGGVC
jgi:hypothetical protein